MIQPQTCHGISESTHARPLRQQVFSWPLSGKTEEVNQRALVRGSRCVRHLCRINMSEVQNAPGFFPSEPAQRPGVAKQKLNYPVGDHISDLLMKSSTWLLGISGSYLRCFMFHIFHQHRMFSRKTTPAEKSARRSVFNIFSND